jgi:exoribonuclease II
MPTLPFQTLDGCKSHVVYLQNRLEKAQSYSKFSTTVGIATAIGLAAVAAWQAYKRDKAEKEVLSMDDMQDAINAWERGER